MNLFERPHADLRLQPEQANAATLAAIVAPVARGDGVGSPVRLPWHYPVWGVAMARLARGEVFDPREVSIFRYINRCVRRCFLYGRDPDTGADYEHRKAWIEQRLEFLAGCFAIDVLGFAVLSDHFHAILRNRPDIVDGWSDTEVARRWCLLCPARKTAEGEPEEPSDAELDVIRNNPQRLAEIRLRLSHISWFMRMVAEPVARRANSEDGCPGRFSQGRSRSVKLCDAAALLACGVIGR